MGSYLGIPRWRKKVLCKLRCIMPVTVFTNSAGFLIRCMRLFDAIREELVPYGTQTFPSVASASLHLINGICAGIRSILLSGIMQLATHVANFFSNRKVGYITPIHPALDRRLLPAVQPLGDCYAEHSNPHSLYPCATLLITV